jgi:hypothetical protein
MHRKNFIIHGATKITANSKVQNQELGHIERPLVMTRAGVSVYQVRSSIDSESDLLRSPIHLVIVKRQACIRDLNRLPGTVVTAA